MRDELIAVFGASSERHRIQIPGYCLINQPCVFGVVNVSLRQVSFKSHIAELGTPCLLPALFAPCEGDALYGWEAGVDPYTGNASLAADEVRGLSSRRQIIGRAPLGWHESAIHRGPGTLQRVTSASEGTIM